MTATNSGASNAFKAVTDFEAGLSGDDQVRIALEAIVGPGGVAQTRDIHEAVEAVINPKGFTRSEQGKSSLRFFVNKVAVDAGYVHPHDREAPGWRITAQGRDFLADRSEQVETSIDVEREARKRARPRPPAATLSNSTSFGCSAPRTRTTHGTTKAETSDASVASTSWVTGWATHVANPAASASR